MPKKILFDGLNLALTKGTGVATYTRVLIQKAKQLGYKNGVLYGTPKKLPQGDLERETAFFDAPDILELPPVIKAVRSAGDYLKAIVPVRPTEVSISGTVITRGLGGRWVETDTVYAAPRIFDQSQGHCAAFNRLMPVVLPEKADLFHFTYPIPIKTNARANIYTVHDLIPLRLPYTTLDHKRFYLKAMRNILAKADRIVTVSENSKRDIVDLFGIEEERVTNTSQAIDLPEHIVNRSENDLADELSGTFDLDYRDYFLFYGSLEPKKNLGRVVEAYLAANTNHPLVVIVGQSWLGKDEVRLLKQIEKQGREHGKRIIRYDYLPFPLLMSLIQGARGVLFPSLYEGFGLPILEAMALGTPVVTSNVSSMPEVAGDATLLVDPYDTQALAQAIMSLAEDDDLRADLRSRGLVRATKFSSDVYLKNLSDLYASLT